MFRAQPGGATFAVSIAKHAAPIFTTVHFKRANSSKNAFYKVDTRLLELCFAMLFI